MGKRLNSFEKVTKHKETKVNKQQKKVQQKPMEKLRGGLLSPWDPNDY